MKPYKIWYISRNNPAEGRKSTLIEAKTRKAAEAQFYRDKPKTEYKILFVES